MSAPAKPVARESERGRELARDLTVALDDIEEAISARRAATSKERAA